MYKNSVRKSINFSAENLHLYHYSGNNPVKYVDPTGETIFMFGLCTNAGCGAGVAENIGVYLATDWKGNISVGSYCVSSVGTFVGVGASGGLEITVAPFATEFSDIAGYSLSGGGSAGLFGVFAIGGEFGYNPTAKTNSEKLKSLTIAISGTIGVPGSSPAEGHIYNSYSVSLSEFKIKNDNSNELLKTIKKLENLGDYENLQSYIQSLITEAQNE